MDHGHTTDLVSKVVKFISTNESHRLNIMRVQELVTFFILQPTMFHYSHKKITNPETHFVVIRTFAWMNLTMFDSKIQTCFCDLFRSVL